MPLLRSSSLVIWVAVGRLSMAGSAAAAGEEEIWACCAMSFFCAAGEQSASRSAAAPQQLCCPVPRDTERHGNTTCMQRCPASFSPSLPISLSLSQSLTVLPHQNAVGCTPAGLPKPVTHHLCSAENRNCCEQAGDSPCFQVCLSASSIIHKMFINETVSSSSVLCLPPLKAIINLGSLSQSHL